MATIRKEVNTLDVTLFDTQGKESMFRINNPKNNITRTQVDDVFNTFIQSGIYYSKNDNPFQSIKSVVKTVVVSTTEEIN